MDVPLGHVSIQVTIQVSSIYPICIQLGSTIRGDIVQMSRARYAAGMHIGHRTKKTFHPRFDKGPTYQCNGKPKKKASFHNPGVSYQIQGQVKSGQVKSGQISPKEKCPVVFHRQS